MLPDGKHFVLLVDADRTEDHYLAIGSRRFGGGDAAVQHGLERHLRAAGLPALHALRIPHRPAVRHEDAEAGFPEWSPDGKTIVYYSAHENPTGGLYKAPADHPGEESPVTVPGRDCTPDAFAPDGRLLLMECFEHGNWDLWITPLDDPNKARQLTSTPFNEGDARLSPDGRWISYSSGESGLPSPLS